jgi:hypothetical protein
MSLDQGTWPPGKGLNPVVGDLPVLEESGGNSAAGIHNP